MMIMVQQYEINAAKTQQNAARVQQCASCAERRQRQIMTEKKEKEHKTGNGFREMFHEAIERRRT